MKDDKHLLTAVELLLLTMATMWFIALALIFGGCGGKLEHERSCVRGCPTEEQDAPRVEYVPVAGPAGPAGPRGESGLGCSVSSGTSECTVVRCGDGFATICDGARGDVGSPGRDGAAGVDGRDGATGAPGEPGTDGTNGRDGERGAPGADSQGIEVVTPCAETAGSVAYPERFLRFADGTVLAYLASADPMQQRLVTLVPGATYITTDGRNCIFTAE